MSSWLKAGKKLVNELKPMVAPNHDTAQYPYGAPAQSYSSPPSTSLSPYFHQQSIQASPASNSYAQAPQIAASGYFGEQQQPQPQPQYLHGGARLPQSPPAAPQQLQHSQQTSNSQQTIGSQYHQPRPQQYQQTIPQQYQQTQSQYQQATQQYQQAQQQQYFQSEQQHNPPPAEALSPQQYLSSLHQYPQSQQHSNPPQNLNPPPSPVVSPPSPAPPPPPPPQPQAWTPLIRNPSTWQPTTSPVASTVELPGAEIPTRFSEQPYHASPPPDASPSPTPRIALSPQHQGMTTSPQLQHQAMTTNITPQPTSAAQYLTCAPNTTSTPISSASRSQQVQTPIMTFSPPPQWHPQFTPNQQSLVPWNQQPQQQQQQLQQYQPTFSPPLSSLYQTPQQNNQLLPLQQGMQVLSVAPGQSNTPCLSSSFKEISRPIATAIPSIKTVRNDLGPSVLRVQTDGHASTLRKILCLDGGGVRGLASLMIVKHLMDRLETERGGRLEPWQEFDMIAGTSTGGLIAIMLGRLRMSVTESIEAYKILSKRIFTPVHDKGNIAGRALTALKADGKFEAEPLEQVVKEICRDRDLSEAELLKDISDDSPKVFVCAAQGINADAIVIRSYKSGDGEWDDLYDVCKIWEAARATSAASTFFPPIQIGYQKYVDGALRYNNPIEKADQESRALWPKQERLIVSVGTGSAPGPNVLGNLADLGKALAKIVVDTEEENTKFMKRNIEMVDNNLLFRFNVLHGLADVKLNEWEAIGEIMAHTGTYMKSPTTARTFTKCANQMKESGQRLGYIAGEDLHVYQKFQQMSEVYAEFCEDCHKGIPYLEKMFLCIECQLFTCEDCHDSHETSHLRNMLRFSVMQWMEKLPGIDTSASCRHCAKDAKSRWQCSDCNMALCRNCVGHHDRRIEFFEEHRQLHPDHRSFIGTYPPYWSTEPQWITSDCQCLNITYFGGHCERCNRVVVGGGRGYFCRTCRSVFGSSQSICLECFENDKEHRERHQFGTYEVVYEDSGPENYQDALKKLWGCSQCSERFGEGKQQNHAHLHLRLIITPYLVELLRRAAYQSCHRKQLLDNLKEVANPIPFQCVLCTKHLAFDQGGSLCLKKDCRDCFCADCTLANRTGHRHYLYEFTVMRSVKNYINQIICNYCRQAYMIALAQGLWCADCKNHFICINCMTGIGNSDTPQIQEGLPHMKILKPCKVKNRWQLYIMDES